jgi:hypothetical protein
LQDKSGISRIVFMALLLSVVIGGTPVWAADGNWHWVRVQPPGPTEDWEVLQGTANVIFNGRNFTTTLVSDTDRTWNHFSITGVIDGTRVTATEVKLNTDAGPLTYKGTIEKIRTPLNSGARRWGWDRIVLTYGSWFIGLERKVPPADGPKE